MTKDAETRPKKKGLFKKLIDSHKESNERSAQEELLQDLFYDMYKNRRQVYKVNFFRGVFFGFGSVIGGTLIVALLIWLISLFVDIPVIGNYFEDIQQTIEQTKQRR